MLWGQISNIVSCWARTDAKQRKCQRAQRDCHRDSQTRFEFEYARENLCFKMYQAEKYKAGVCTPVSVFCDLANLLINTIHMQRNIFPSP